MQCYELTAPNGPDGWMLAQRPGPAPGVRQVLISVKAVSLNYRDLLTSKNPGIAFPRIPLSDGAGVVLAVGDGVTGVRVGDRVAGCFFQNWAEGDVRAEIHDAALGGSIDGMLAEEVVLEEDGVVKIPDYLIKPIVDEVLPFNKAPDALRLMESGGHFGKIVMQVGQ